MTMTAPALTYPELKALNPCAGDFKRVTRLMGGAKKWDGKKISAKAARKAGATYDDILWAASTLARTDKDVERRIRLWLADCAARVLQNYENTYPDDERPRDAVVVGRAYARDLASSAASSAAYAAFSAASSAAYAAYSAAYSAASSAAYAAFSAAYSAASSAAYSAASSAAYAASSAAYAACSAAWSAEHDWQFDRLIEWLSAKEPEDWPLPAKQAKKVAA